MDLKRALRELQGDAGRAAKPEPAARAPLVEIFHSIQGEGRFVGVPMTFVRAATCPLRCRYCDTPDSYAAPGRFPVRLGVRDQHEPNPVAADRAADLARLVAATCEPGSRTPRVSLTGGEPLVFPQFVREFGRAVRQKGLRLHLETAAIDPAALGACIDQVDHLSADYKLPETLGPPAPGAPPAPSAGYGEVHRQCVETALRRGATVDVKIVLTAEVTDQSVERALADLAGCRDRIVLVLQPATPFGAAPRSVARPELERFLAAALRGGFDVRVLPQVHKALRLP
ncbi:MAG: 7-carboxy-7-deazaguanine synthase QueE [Planctomycetes bacterium]|nr:7-carboxy-7-deazaguanine synthase QueE [Planctomycetota bacterium]